MSFNRREFMTRMLPASVALGFGCTNDLLLAGAETKNLFSQDESKFTGEISPAPTYKQWARDRNQRYIGILKQMEKELGKERLLDLLKKASYAENVALGKRLSPRITSMKIFAGPFRNDNSRVGRTIVREIVEDTEKAFEMKITHCLTEIVFGEAGARDLGYACVCHADFGLPEGMDLNIKLIRTKTLMQGHDCCNHRYVLEG